jgi:ATP-dependent DNA helicase RecQ
MFTTSGSRAHRDGLVTGEPGVTDSGQSSKSGGKLREAMNDELQSGLKQFFGYETFRPLQQEIISAALDGRDVFAVLPTGAGKSLCFQLPSLVRPGLTLVISPLIALMKDQVDSLHAAGVPATFLNSTLDPATVREREQGLDEGRFRLLYVAPERALLEGFLDRLGRWNPTLIAIDEAHCISEWGHDFRPEYGRLAVLRERLPQTPVMAVTATATERVRADIVVRLGLRQPATFLASFNRPNLTYSVVGKSRAASQVLRLVSERPQESGIVYCQSRKSAEHLAAHLSGSGLSAVPYHASLPPEERGRNQEAFLRDEVQVICATIAFGMGINKPNVRYVIHHDLPKTVEGYYQETGRAGRDGLPAECVLLFSPGDVVKQRRFISDKPDPEEQKIATEQLNHMLAYAEIGGCRRHGLLQYFGEEFPGENCGSCDNCLAPRTDYDATVPAQQFLSCVYRIQQHSGFGLGLNHVVDVLHGSASERIRRFGHETLTTYGIGRERSRAEWQAIGRDLARHRLVAENPEHRSWELTADGRAFLRERRSLTLTRSLATATGDNRATRRRAGDIICDEALFENLRRLRKELADSRDVPAYVIFSDVTLRHLARDYPESIDAFGAVSGVGEKKKMEFGAPFLAEITRYVAANGTKVFPAEAPLPAPPAGSDLAPTASVTLKLYREGKGIEEIAAERKLAVGTISGHLAQAVEAGADLPPRDFYTEAEEARMAEAFATAGFETLTAAKELVGDDIDYGKIRFYRALTQRPASPSS